MTMILNYYILKVDIGWCGSKVEKGHSRLMVSQISLNKSLAKFLRDDLGWLGLKVNLGQFDWRQLI